jgi:hypothetical protein
LIQPKVNLRKILAIILLLNSFPLWSETPSYHNQLEAFCKLQKELSCENLEVPLPPKLELAQISTVLACQNYYQASHCEEVKNSLGKDRHSLIVSCDPKQLCKDYIELDKVQCAIDGAKDQFTFLNLAFLVGMGIGGNVALATSSVMLPALVYSAGKTAEECHKDTNYKMMAVRMHNLSLMEDERPLDVQGKNKALLDMQCADLNSFLRNRLDELVRQRTERQMWSVNGKVSKQSAESKAMLELLRSNKCLRPAHIKENLCKGLSGLVTGVLISGGTNLITRAVSGNIALPKLTLPKLSKAKYKEKKLRWIYIGEESSGVKYFSKETLQKYKVSVNSEGKLVDARGKPLNVKEGMYVMDAEGNFYVHPGHVKGELHHSSFFAGGPVAGAGELTVVNGVLRYIDRSSGHYQPESLHFQQVVEELSVKGVDVKNAQNVNNYK